MQIGKKYSLIAIAICLMSLIIIFGAKILDFYAYSSFNKILKTNGWTMQIKTSSGNFLTSIKLENINLYHESGTTVKIDNVLINLGLFSSIFDELVLDLLNIEGLDICFIKSENISKKHKSVNDFINIPFHIKSFFVDGRLSSKIQNENYIFNIIMGGRLKGMENPNVNFDLLKVFLERDINLDCNINQMLFGHDGASFYLKDIKGELFNLPISGDLYFLQDKNKINGTLDLMNFTMPKELLSLLPLKTKFSKINGKLKFESDFEFFTGELILENKLGLEMNGKFRLQKQSKSWVLKVLELSGEKSNLAINGSWENGERISCFLNLDNLDLSRWIKNQKPTQMSGLLIMEANLTDEMALNQIDMTLEIVEKKLFNQGEISIHGLLTYGDSMLSTIDPVMLFVGDSYLTIDGKGDFSTNTIDLFIDMEQADIELVNNFLLGNFVSGKATGKLKVSGDLHSPSVVSELFCEDVNVNDFELSSIELVSHINVEDTIASGFVDIKAEHGKWKERSFESGTVNVIVDDQSLIIENCHFKSGNDFLQASGIYDGEFSYTIEMLQLAYQNNYLVNAKPILLSIKDSILQVNPFEFHINDGMMEGVISGGDHMKGQFKMSNFDAKILTQFINDNRLKLSGLIFGEIEVVSRKKNIDLDVDISLKKGVYMEEKFDEMIISGLYKNGILHLDDISITRQNSLGIHASGIIPLTKNDMDHIKISLESNFFNMPLEFIHRFIPKFYKISGLATGGIRLNGTPQKTQFSYDVKIENSIFDLVKLESISSKGKYDGKSLFIENINSDLKGGNITASGEVPFDLNIGSKGFGSLFYEDSINFQASSYTNSLPFLSPYIVDLDSTSGDYSIILSLIGKADDIQRSGSINIKNATLYTLLVSDPILSINGSGKMKNNLLDINEFHANLYHSNGKYEKPKQHNTTIDGSINFSKFFKPDYNLKISSTNSSYRLLAFDISGQSNLDISITGRDTIAIDGTIETQDANIYYEFTTEDVGTAIEKEQSTVMSYNLNIPIRGKALFQNSQIDAQVTGELNLSQIGHQEMNFGGQIIVEDGNFFWYKDNFQSLNGVVNFDNKGFNPSINLAAYTMIDNEEINLRMLGEVNDLDIILESASGFSESDILELLALGKRFEEFETTSTGFGNQTVSILGALLENQLEKNLKESNTVVMNYVDNINISGAAGLLQDTNEDFEVTAEKQIGKKTFLNLSYKRSFSLNQDQSQVGVEYKLNRHFSVVGNVDDDGNLNLKYRYKYAY